MSRLEKVIHWEMMNIEWARAYTGCPHHSYRGQSNCSLVRLGLQSSLLADREPLLSSLFSQSQLVGFFRDFQPISKPFFLLS